MNTTLKTGTNNGRTHKRSLLLRCLKGLSISFYIRMLVSTLLLALLLSTTSSILANDQLGSCGCAMERHLSVNQGRIPSIITELNCHQAGTSCGTEPSLPSKVSFSKLVPTTINVFLLNSVVNCLDSWMLDTLAILGTKKW